MLYSLDLLLSQFASSPLSHCGSNCCSLTYIQVPQEAGQVVWYSHLCKNFPHSLSWSTQSKALESSMKQIFLEFSCFFYDPVDVGNLISHSPAFSKSNLNKWKFLVHILLKPIGELWALLCLVCEMSAIWTFFVIAVLWDLNENWPFPLLRPLLSFPNVLPYWVQHFNTIIF